MLDVITIVTPRTPPEWVDQCRASIREAIVAAPYSVRAIEAPWVPGHVGQAMMAAFTRSSSAPYVAWVDDDDYVLPNAFACLAPHFDSDPEAICAREWHLGARGQTAKAPAQRRHHLTAWRRDVIARSRIGETKAPPIPVLLSEVARVVDVLEWVYVWRRYRSQGMALRNAWKSQQVPS